MFEELIHFWKTNVDLKSGNYIAKADQPFLTKVKQIPPQSFADFIDSEEYGIKGCKLIHSGLLPRPYSGDIENAKVFVLMINPGFGAWNYYEQENPDYKDVWINNLRQRNPNRKYPFSSLNPKYSWTGGSRYWNKKFYEVIKAVQDEKQCGFQEAASFVSQNFSVFELFPYQSQTFGISNKVLNSLPSVQLIKKCVLETARQNPDLLFIVTRKVGMWGLPENKKNIINFTRGESRGASLKPYIPQIMRYLKIK
jgi:hypothetical protein